MADDRPDDHTLPEAFDDALESCADEAAGTRPAPTPGQVAYTAYCETRDPWWLPDFTLLPPEAQHCWDVAAQAVLADTPRFQFALGSHVRRTCDPAQCWEIWSRTCREEVGRTWIDYGLRLIDPKATYHPCRFSDGTDLVPAEETPDV